MTPINRQRLIELDERDRQVREDVRAEAQRKAWTRDRYVLPEPGAFTYEQFRELRRRS